MLLLEICKILINYHKNSYILYVQTADFLLGQNLELSTTLPPLIPSLERSDQHRSVCCPSLIYHRHQRYFVKLKC